MMIKTSLQKSHQRWIDDGCQEDWWDGLDESMLEVNFWLPDDGSPLQVAVYQNVDVTDLATGKQWIETNTDRFVDVSRWVHEAETDDI